MSQSVHAWLVQSVQWPASEGVPNVFDFEPSPGLPIGLPLDCATACVGSGGMIYSNFRESRVKVTGPYIHPKLNQNRIGRCLGSWMSPH
jgi:hypothetical protein